MSRTRASEREIWLARNWRIVAAFVYLFICLFDFVIAPSWVGFHRETTAELVMAIKDLSPSVQIILAAPKSFEWNPLTLIGAGIFHVAFGTILGASAWSHGRERIEALRQDGATQRTNLTPMAPLPPLPQMDNPDAKTG